LMPPGVSGLLDNGSGASRVHSTKPSGRGAPEATPRLNGLPPRQFWAAAMRIICGAARLPTPPSAVTSTQRRVRLLGMIRFRIAPVAVIAIAQHIGWFV